MLIPNSVYLFTCECQIETYVGQTRKILKSRIFQHGSAKRHSNIYNHTSQCEIFLNARQNKYGIAPNDTQCRSFLLEHFKCLKSNLANWHERMGYESLCITQLQPTLNKQKKFQKPNLICTCVTKIEDYTSLVPCAFHLAINSRCTLWPNYFVVTCKKKFLKKTLFYSHTTKLTKTDESFFTNKNVVKTY